MSGRAGLGRPRASGDDGWRFLGLGERHGAGASAVAYEIQFTATTALAQDSGFVQLTAPSGGTLSGSRTNYSVTVTGTGAFGPTEASNVTAGGNSNVADIYMPNAVAAGDTVQIRAFQSTNPASANSGATFSMSTSTDTTATVPVAFPITNATAVTGLTATSSSPYAGSQEVEDTVTFTASSGMLYELDTPPPNGIPCTDGVCNQGDITLTLPTGTKLDPFEGDYFIEDVTTSQSQSESGIAGGSGSTISLNPTFTINAGDTVKVILYEVANPASPGSGTLSVSTSSDAASPATSTPFDYGSPVAPTNVSVAATSTTPSATNTDYLIGLTTSSALPYYNGGSDGTGWIILTFPDATDVRGLDQATVYMSDATHPTLTDTNTPPGQYGYSLSDNQVMIPVGFAVPANDNLTIKLVGAKNPATFTMPTFEPRRRQRGLHHHAVRRLDRAGPCRHAVLEHELRCHRPDQWAVIHVQGPGEADRQQ